MAKAKEESAAQVAVVESVTDVAETEYRADEELDAKFGSKQALGDGPKAAPLENIVEARMSRQEPKRPDEGDLKLDPRQWVKTHFNRIAGKDIGAEVEFDEWNHGLILVKVRGREGSISTAHIDELRKTRHLDHITRSMQSFLSGYLPEYRLQDE